MNPSAIYNTVILALVSNGIPLPEAKIRAKDNFKKAFDFVKESMTKIAQNSKESNLYNFQKKALDDLLKWAPNNL